MIREQGYSTLAFEIQFMAHLQKLDLSCNKMITWTGFASLIKGLAKMQPKLRTLNLSGTLCQPLPAPMHRFRFSVTDVQQSLQQLAGLQDLNLSNNMLDDTLAIAIAKALPHMPELRKLDMTLNFLEVVGVTALVMAASNQDLPDLLVLAQDSDHFAKSTVNKWREIHRGVK